MNWDFWRRLSEPRFGEIKKINKKNKIYFKTHTI